MKDQANDTMPRPKYTIHTCDRHSDLTILLKAAKKKICNHCFATLKKSYYNVIAGLLLGEQYLNTTTRGLQIQNSQLVNKLQEQQEAILRVQAELSEHINKGGKNHAPTQSTGISGAPIHPPVVSLGETPTVKEACATGHVSKTAHAVQDMLKSKIAGILKTWKNTRDRTAPKTDDHQDSKGITHTHGGFLMR